MSYLTPPAIPTELPAEIQAYLQNWLDIGDPDTPLLPLGYNEDDGGAGFPDHYAQYETAVALWEAEALYFLDAEADSATYADGSWHFITLAEVNKQVARGVRFDYLTSGLSGTTPMVLVKVTQTAAEAAALKNLGDKLVEGIQRKIEMHEARSGAGRFGQGGQPTNEAFAEFVRQMQARRD